MKIKKNDTIIVIAGKDRGKTGKVLRAFPLEDLILVEGINVKKRHQRATRANQKGQIIERSMPIHVSNAMLVDPKTGGRTRVGYTIEKGKNVRVTKKSKTPLS